MVFVLNEEKAAKIFAKYRNVAAFSLGKSKGFEDAEKTISVSYQKLAFLPSQDTINGVLDGSIKAKKVINDAVKRIMKIKPDDEGTGIAMAMAQLINILQDNTDEDISKMSKKQYKRYMKKHGPNILVFVLDGENPAKDKFLKKFITAIFDVFGYEVIDSNKVVKKLFKGKRKGINDRVRDFIDANKGMKLSKEGRTLYKLTTLYYRTELLQLSMSATSDEYEFKLGEKTAEKLAKSLVMKFSNMNIAELEKYDLSKKQFKKLAKTIRGANEDAVDHYNELRDILVKDIELPKIKGGITKKSRKAGDPEPKMNVKKFVKFYRKKDNRGLLRLVYAHLVCRSMDVAIGSSSYNKHISEVLSSEYGSDFSKAFISAAKEYAKSTPVA